LTGNNRRIIPPPVALFISGYIAPHLGVPEFKSINFQEKDDTVPFSLVTPHDKKSFIRESCKLLGDNGLLETWNKNPGVVKGILPSMLLSLFF